MHVKHVLYQLSYPRESNSDILLYPHSFVNTFFQKVRIFLPPVKRLFIAYANSSLM